VKNRPSRPLNEEYNNPQELEVIFGAFLMTKKRKRLILFTGLLFAALLVLGAVLIWVNPLFGSPLPTFEPFSGPPATINLPPNTTIISTSEANEPGESLPELEETPDLSTPTVTDATVPSAKAVCGGPDSMSVLVLGIDKSNQADAIRLVRIDFVEKKISILAIPRDFYLPIVDMTDHGITIGRINATYGYGEYFNGKGMGIVSIAENLNYNYGVTFDHYIVMNFDNFAKYIDILGGVDIYLEQPVNGTSQKLGYYKQGEHHLNGESAIDFMRIRYIDSDFYRIRRQTQVFTALYDKVMTELTLGKILNIGYTFVSDSSVQSDFAVKDVAPLLCLAKSLKPSDIQFVEIPQDMYKGFTTPKGGAVKIPDDRVIELVQSVMRGNYQE